MLSPAVPPDLEACLDSVTCVLSTTLAAVLPLSVLVLVALHLLGVRIPDFAIFTEFVCKCQVSACFISVAHSDTALEDAAAVAAEEEAARTKPKPTAVPDADIPTERSSLLPNSNAPITKPDTWRQVALTGFALLEVTGWTINLVNQATHLNTSNGVGIFGLVTTATAVASWVYSALRPSIRPSRTPYYDLFILYFSYFLASTVALYEVSTSVVGPIGFSWGRLAQVLNALITFAGLVVIVNMPLSTIGKPEVDEDVRAFSFYFYFYITFGINLSFAGLAPVARRPLHNVAMDDFYLGQPAYLAGRSKASRREGCMAAEQDHAHSRPNASIPPNQVSTSQVEA